VDYKDLLSNKQISHTLPDLAKDLKEMPEKILDCLGVAIHQVGFVLRIYISVTVLSLTLCQNLGRSS